MIKDIKMGEGGWRFEIKFKDKKILEISFVKNAPNLKKVKWISK